MAIFSENPPNSEKLMKKLLKKLKNKGEKPSDSSEKDYKLTGFDTTYEKHANLLQNLMKYICDSDEKSELFSKILGKRSNKPHFDISNSLKYLDDSIFSKRKKLKKIKGKKETEFFNEFGNHPFYNSFLNANPIKKDEKIENNTNFNGFFPNKMLTNFPNNPQNLNFNGQNQGFSPNFVQNTNFANNSTANFSEIYPFNNNGGFQKVENPVNSSNFLNSPFIDNQSNLGLSRKNSINCGEMQEFQNFDNNQYNFGPILESPAINYSFNNNNGFPFLNPIRNNMKDEVILFDFLI